MSKYTTELRWILEELTGLQGGYNNVENIIANGIPKLFDFEFPIFDEKYRSVLLTKICKHYYTQEIGCETVGLWKLRLNTKLNEIMPYYNKLYESELLTFNPLYDIDVTTSRNNNKNDITNETNSNTLTENSTDNDNDKQTENGTNVLNGTLSNESNTSINATSISNVKDRYSETPQGTISDIADNTYLTNATITDTENTNNNTATENSTATSKNTSEDERTIQRNKTNEYNKKADSSTNKNGTFKSTEEYLESIQGKTHGTSFSTLLNEYRTTFLNIDIMIINELAELFIQLW